MNLFQYVKNRIQGSFRNIRKEAGAVLKGLSRSYSPLADRILSDAMRIAEIPSPTVQEAQRTRFILDRLNAIGLHGSIDEEGNVLVRFSCPDADDPRPILLYTDIGSTRWHPLESLSHVDAEHAYGAGLSDALGAASLLGVAESLVSGSLQCRREVILLFTAKNCSDPEASISKRLCADTHTRPVAGLGVRGFELGALHTRALGTYRLEVFLNTETPATASSAVDAAVLVARNLSSVIWDAERSTVCRIKRIEAGSGFGKEAREGRVQIELESSNKDVLDLAVKAAMATAEASGKDAGAAVEVRVAGYVPVGNIELSKNLQQILLSELKEQHIKIGEDTAADPASFFSELGIPAVSMGMAQGQEGLHVDKINIDSLEKGRKVLYQLIKKMGEGAFL